MHDTITVGIPLVAILFGILFNQMAVDKLESRLDARLNAAESRIDSRFNAVNGRLDRMQADLSQFYRTLGQHDADIANMKAKKA